MTTRQNEQTTEAHAVHADAGVIEPERQLWLEEAIMVGRGIHENMVAHLLDPSKTPAEHGRAKLAAIVDWWEAR